MEKKMSTHDDMIKEWNTYLEENDKFTTKGVKASAARARKALGNVRKLAGGRRKEIMDQKKAATESK
jgi:hypothetical protein